jgi:hypothetical protein
MATMPGFDLAYVIPGCGLILHDLHAWSVRLIPVLLACEGDASTRDILGQLALDKVSAARFV